MPYKHHGDFYITKDIYCSGYIRQQFANITQDDTPYTVPSGVDYIFCSGTTDITIYLPDATINQGRSIHVKRFDDINGTELWISGTNDQTIDGRKAWTISSQYEALEFVSNGENWFIF